MGGAAVPEIPSIDIKTSELGLDCFVHSFPQNRRDYYFTAYLALIGRLVENCTRTLKTNSAQVALEDLHNFGLIKSRKKIMSWGNIITPIIMRRIISDICHVAVKKFVGYLIVIRQTV